MIAKRSDIRSSGGRKILRGLFWKGVLLIGDDSFIITNSLLEKEGMAGQVQMVYIDPPNGIKYGSNFQPFVNKRGLT